MALALHKDKDNAFITSSGSTVVDSGNLLVSKNAEKAIQDARALYEKLTISAEKVGKPKPISVEVRTKAKAKAKAKANR